MWVADGSCPVFDTTDLPYYGCTPPLYNVSGSSTANVTNEGDFLEYGKGVAVGAFGSDVVSVGNFTSNKQTLLVVGRAFGLPSLNGIMGFGGPALCQRGLKSFFNQLLDENQLEEPMFSMWFNPEVR